MFGVTQDEGLLNVMDILADPENDTNFATVRDNWDRIGPYQLFDQHPDWGELTDEVVELSHRVADFYFGGIQHYDLAHLQSIVDMYSDAWFWYTVHDWGRLLVQQNLPTWQYMFSFEATFGLLLLAGVPHAGRYGVCHGDEVPLLFGAALTPALPARDIAVSRELVGWWSQFAKSGEPGGDWAGLAESGQYLLINTTSRMEYSQTYSDRMEFWRQLCGPAGCRFGSGLPDSTHSLN